MNTSTRRICFTAPRLPLSFSSPSHHLQRAGKPSQQLRAFKATSALRNVQGTHKPPRQSPSEAEPRAQRQQNAIDEEANRNLLQGFKRQAKSKQALLYALIAANTAVFVAWQYGNLLQSQAGEDPTAMRKAHQWKEFMVNNFVQSEENVQKGRWWTYLTSAISQQGILHFGVNMFSLRNAGTFIVHALPQVSPLSFAALCLGSTLASAAAAQWSGRLTGDLRGGLGASGMLCGVMGAATCAFPQQLWVNTAIWFTFDLGILSTDLRYSSPLGHAAHLGGTVFGVVFYLAAIRRGKLPKMM
ncbi:hypothetical protein FKW77_001300 [Venturia effusa]|uniref:Peptidase S54 rhomboid domain-containing protein n=1 Tax=Venturia effusa TaxID=50376 RepID=A0A517LQL4_9PEZI|nr:hypothetical protein FKW77_001300 [Venturia effusa]